MLSLRTHVVLTLGLAAQPVAAQPRAVPRPPDVPYVTTPRDIARAMLAAARVGPSDVVFDLGCGDGRILIIAAQEFGARGVGIDIDPRRVREARANVQAAGLEEAIGIWREDMFTVDLRPATVVTLYLSRVINNRLRPKLIRELRPGSRVVSHNINMEGWRATAVQELNGHRIFCWIVSPELWPVPQTPSKVRRNRD